MNTGNYIYLYCITKEQPKLDTLEALADGLYLIPGNNLYATVCNVSKNEFDEENLKHNLRDLEWLKSHAQRHEIIIEGIMKETTVIPSKFATVFFNEQNLQSFLEKYAGDLKEKLDYLENKQEWGIKIYFDHEKLTPSILLENEMILAIDNQINAASPGKAYFLQKKKTGLKAKAVEDGIVRYRKVFLELLQNFCVQTKINEITPRQFTGRDEDMILNVAFLIEDDMVPKFIKQLNAFVSESEFTAFGFHFESSGPWPPYNFSQLTER